MNDAALVRRRQRAPELARDPDQLTRAEPAGVQLVQQLLQRAPLQQLHHQERQRHAVVHVARLRIDDAGDVARPQRARRARLAQESIDRLRVRGQPRIDGLERQRLQRFDVLHAPHGPHPALAQQALDPETAVEDLPGQIGSRSGCHEALARP